VKLDADKVRWHRDSRGWTLDTTAEKAEVALGTILRAEHGEDIRPSSGRRIARAFGVDVSELVPDKPGVLVHPLAEAPEAGRPSIIDIASDAARRQVALEKQAMARARETAEMEGLEKAQMIDMSPANEAMRRLREEYSLSGNDAEALVDFALADARKDEELAALRSRLQEREQAHS